MTHDLIAPASRAAAQRDQFRLACDQARRSPYAVMAADALVAWLLTRAELAPWACAWGWWLVSAAVSLARAGFASHEAHRIAAGQAASTKAFVSWFFAVGLTRTWPVLIAFHDTSHDLHYLVTMVMMGLAAGGVGSAVGLVRLYLAWSVPVALGLAGAWLGLRSVEATWIAVLLVLMFLLLTVYVRDHGRTLERQFELAEKLRAERDHVEVARRRAEEERLRAEAAVVARTRFFAAASHDLRQPLSVLRWYGDAVSAHAERLEHEALGDIGDGIGRALDRAEPLVRKYLDISRMDAGALDISLQPCQVAAVLEKVRDAFAREAEERHLRLRTSFGGPVAEFVVVTDESVLRNILDNLVSNALKFTPHGAVTLGARLLRHDDRRIVRVSVEDTGIGIAAADLERVFDDFYQVGNPERSHSKGVGLGLAIARRQGELLGFSLRVRSTVGQGSTFEFDLAAAPGAEVPRVPAPSPGPQQHVLNVLNVLIVDDEPEVRLSLRMMLEVVGWTVATAAGLTDALAVLESGFEADALVVDYRLQADCNGAEVVAELRAAGCRAAAVIVTGDTAPDRLAAMKASGLPVLHKPVNRDRLLSTLMETVTART